MFEDRQLRQRAIIALVVLTVTAVILFIVLRNLGGDGEARVVLRNVGECSEVTMVLTARDGSERITLVAPRGEDDETVVQPNLTYDYEITTPDEPDENNRLCNFNDVGTVVVPPGSTQTFNIASERPPTETPESE